MTGSVSSETEKRHCLSKTADTSGVKTRAFLMSTNRLLFFEFKTQLKMLKCQTTCPNNSGSFSTQSVNFFAKSNDTCLTFPKFMLETNGTEVHYIDEKQLVWQEGLCMQGIRYSWTRDAYTSELSVVSSCVACCRNLHFHQRSYCLQIYGKCNPTEVWRQDKQLLIWRSITLFYHDSPWKVTRKVHSKVQYIYQVIKSILDCDGCKTSRAVYNLRTISTYNAV